MTCAACIAAGQSAKAEGHRNWRTGWACFDHAAVDLDSWLAEHGYPVEALPTQPDLFGAAA